MAQRIDPTAAAILEMVRFFLPRSEDQSTMHELEAMALDERKWRNAHALFSRIRQKTLRAERSNNELLGYQYGFEEICAKTLFNLSSHFTLEREKFPEPFDHDSPFWVVPIAIQFAQVLGVKDPCEAFSLLRPHGHL